MEKIISLIKTDFNTTFGISSIAYNFRNKKNRFRTIILGVAMLSLLPSYLLLIKSLNIVYSIYSQIGQRPIFLLTGFLIAQAAVFLFGLLYVMSKYYFSNDLSQLVPLPIKPSYILGSKFATLMISEYLTSLPIILPFILMYGIRGGEGILYWVYSFLLIMTLPIIPLVLSSILVMFFMKYTNIGRRKDLVRILSMVVFLVLLIYIQLKINVISQKVLFHGEGYIIDLILDSNLLVKSVGLKFPPSMWATLSLTNYSNIAGLGYLLMFTSVGVSVFIIMIFLSENLFFDGLIGNIEFSASEGRTGKKVAIKDSIRQLRPYTALAKKEIIMIFKTPVYLFNSVGGVILIPIMAVLIFITSADEFATMTPGVIEINPELIVLAGIAYISSMGMLNSIGATTFSREGRNLWIQRTLPIKVRDQIIGRVLSSVVIQLSALITLLVALAIITKLEISTIILITVLGLLGSIPMTLLGMVVDIMRPLLSWTNPQQAMKQNLNVLIGIGLGTLYAIGIIYVVFNLIGKVSMNSIFIVLAVLFIASSIILYYVLEGLITKQFEILE